MLDLEIATTEVSSSYSKFIFDIYQCIKIRGRFD